MRNDVKLPSEKQRRELSLMLHDVLVVIRILGWQEKGQQAGDLADAFHNLPVYLNSENFSFEVCRMFLESYYKKYPERVPFDFLKRLDEIAEH